MNELSRLPRSLTALAWLLCATSCLPVGGAEGEGEGEGEGERPDFAVLEAAIEGDLAANLATGAQVAVWIDDAIYVVGAFGARDPVTGEPTTQQTQFCIGSDTKKLTSLAALLAVAGGSLALDATIADVLPDLSFPNAPALEGATLHQLLSHQGGSNDWVDYATETTDDQLRAVTYGAFASEVYSMAPPGIFYNYANPNFSLAGQLVEEVAGVPFADILEDELFAPLGMSATVGRKASVGDEGAGGTGYPITLDGEVAPLSFEDTWESAFTRPAGMVWSTAQDQMRLARFLVDGDGDVLEHSLREQIMAAQVPTYPDLPGAYGYGLGVSRGIWLGSNYYDVPVWTHGGNTLTHTSTFFMLPEQRFAISVLSNGFGDDFTSTLVAAVQTLVELPAATAQPPAPPAPTVESLLALVGPYVDPFNVGDVNVTSDGTTLSLAMPLLDDANIPYEPLLSPVSARVFLATIQGEPMETSFIDGPDGVTYLATRYFVAARPGAQGRSFTGMARPERLRRALRTTPPQTRLHELIGPAGFVNER